MFYGTIEVIRPNGDLRRQVWEFTLIRDTELVVNHYAFQSRAKRHKWVSQNYYGRFHRDGTMTKDQVVIPSDVVKEATQKLMDMIRVGV